MKLREEEFYEQYHQHGGTTIIPTEIFNELYDDATEEIEIIEDKKIEKLNLDYILDNDISKYFGNKINEIIDVINKGEEWKNKGGVMGVMKNIH